MQLSVPLLLVCALWTSQLAIGVLLVLYFFLTLLILKYLFFKHFYSSLIFIFCFGQAVIHKLKYTLDRLRLQYHG